MFEARIWVNFEQGESILLGEELVKQLVQESKYGSERKVSTCEVLVESGGVGQPKGSSKMTLRCWNKNNGYHARCIPITSRPREEYKEIAK